MHTYHIQETLASGSTSKVKRLRTTDNKELAIKIMKKTTTPLKSFNKELTIHKSLQHKNIIKYIDSCQDTENYYLIMDLAEYELHDFIENNTGIDPIVVQFLIKQLINGIEYLHLKGICHRDIKPENLLLDSNGTLLISDFGYSTYFKYKNKYRRLRTIAGSREYMAPEVCMENYDGELCDVWSVGITIIVLLTGCIPWNNTLDDEKFITYCSMKYHYYPPFSKIRDKIINLIKKILVVEKRRCSLEFIKMHPWVNEESVVNKDNVFKFMPVKENVKFMFSQPEINSKSDYESGIGDGRNIRNGDRCDYEDIRDGNRCESIYDYDDHDNSKLKYTNIKNIDNNKNISNRNTKDDYNNKSKHIKNKNINNNITHIINNHQNTSTDKLQLSQPIKNENHISQLHRFYKTGNLDKVQKKVIDLLNCMVVPFNLHNNVITFNTSDSKRGNLKGDITVQKIGDECYITVKKVKGDYSEFKKFLNSFGENFEGAV